MVKKKKRSHRIIYLKGMNFTLCKLYLNQPDLFKKNYNNMVKLLFWKDHSVLLHGRKTGESKSKNRFAGVTVVPSDVSPDSQDQVGMLKMGRSGSIRDIFCSENWEDLLMDRTWVRRDLQLSRGISKI